MRANELTDRDLVVARLMAAFEAFMQRMALTHAPEFTEIGMTMAQAKVLYLVHAAGEMRMSELAARLGVTLSTTSGLVERLVESGLVTRHDDPADRRQVVVGFTESGAAQIDRLRELNADHMGRMLARVPDEDLLVVERAIRVLSMAADDAVRSVSPRADGFEPSAAIGGNET